MAGKAVSTKRIGVCSFLQRMPRPILLSPIKESSPEHANELCKTIHILSLLVHALCANHALSKKVPTIQWRSLRKKSPLFVDMKPESKQRVAGAAILPKNNGRTLRLSN